MALTIRRSFGAAYTGMLLAEFVFVLRDDGGSDLDQSDATMVEVHPGRYVFTFPHLWAMDGANVLIKRASDNFVMFDGEAGTKDLSTAVYDEVQAALTTLRAEHADLELAVRRIANNELLFVYGWKEYTVSYDRALEGGEGFAMWAHPDLLGGGGDLVSLPETPGAHVLADYYNDCAYLWITAMTLATPLTVTISVTDRALGDPFEFSFTLPVCLLAWDAQGWVGARPGADGSLPFIYSPNTPLEPLSIQDTQTVLDRLGTPAGASISADIAEVLAASGGGSGAAGSGADSVTLTINDAVGNPIANCECWITSDVGGTTVVAGTLTTNDAGQVTFMLEGGVAYYLWRHKAGMTLANPQAFTAVAD